MIVPEAVNPAPKVEDFRSSDTGGEPCLVARCSRIDHDGQSTMTGAPG
jgi:hypothetical protein